MLVRFYNRVWCKKKLEADRFALGAISVPIYDLVSQADRATCFVSETSKTLAGLHMVNWPSPIADNTRIACVVHIEHGARCGRRLTLSLAIAGTNVVSETFAEHGYGDGAGDIVVSPTVDTSEPVYAKCTADWQIRVSNRPPPAPLSTRSIQHRYGTKEAHRPNKRLCAEAMLSVPATVTQWTMANGDLMLTCRQKPNKQLARCTHQLHPSLSAAMLTLTLTHYRIDKAGFSPELFANGAVDTVANLTRDTDGWHSTPPVWYFHEPEGWSIDVPSSHAHTVVSYDIVRVRIPLSYFSVRIGSGKVDAFGARCTLTVPDTVVDLAKSISKTLRDTPTGSVSRILSNVDAPDVMLVESVARAMVYVWTDHNADYSDTLPSTTRHDVVKPINAPIQQLTGRVPRQGPSPNRSIKSARYIPPIAVRLTTTAFTSTTTSTTPTATVKTSTIESPIIESPIIESTVKSLENTAKTQLTKLFGDCVPPKLPINDFCYDPDVGVLSLIPEKHKHRFQHFVHYVALNLMLFAVWTVGVFALVVAIVSRCMLKAVN